MRATAALAGIAGAVAWIFVPLSRDDDGSDAENFGELVPMVGAGVSAINLIILGALARVRRKHRLQIPAWSGFGASGLMLRF